MSIYRERSNISNLDTNFAPIYSQAAAHPLVNPPM